MTFNKFIIAIAISTLPLACSAGEKKKDSEWWVKCKPVENSINEISKSNQYGSSAVDKIFQKNKEFPDCRDGIYGEGMSDIVVKSLASDFSNMVKSASSNKDLGEFLVKHIDSTADWADLDKVIEHAKSSCPSEAKKFCVQLKDLSMKASANAKAAAK